MIDPNATDMEPELEMCHPFTAPLPAHYTSLARHHWQTLFIGMETNKNDPIDSRGGNRAQPTSWYYSCCCCCWWGPVQQQLNAPERGEKCFYLVSRQ